MTRLAAFLLLAPAIIGAQAPNPTNIWVADLRWKGDNLVIGTPPKLTHDDGVNSQPSFSPDGRYVIFSATRDTGAAARSDIHRTAIATGREEQVTHTAENENSPTMNARGEYMAIRWNPATLFKEYGPWVYSRDGTPLRGILRGPDTTGYYLPLGGGRYQITRPKGRGTVLAMFDSTSGVITDIDSVVPNLPAQKIPGENAISYLVVDLDNGRHVLHRYDLASGTMSSLGSALMGRTAHSWIPGRKVVLMGKGNAIYMRRMKGDTSWRRVATFTNPGLRNVAAYAVSLSGNRLVITSTLRPSFATMLRDSIDARANLDALATRFSSMDFDTITRDYDVSDASIAALAADRLRRNSPQVARIVASIGRQLQPTYYRSAEAMGDAMLALRDTTGAVASYTEALSRNPASTDAEKRVAESLRTKLEKLRKP